MIKQRSDWDCLPQAVENSETRAKLWTKIEDLLQQLNTHHNQLGQIQQRAEDNLAKYEQIVQQREAAEAREAAAIAETREIINFTRKSA